MTKSQKVRFLIRQHWVADESDLTCEQYYEEKMDKYIEYLVAKLREKEAFMEDIKELAKETE
jgi:hypothetical protein